jgi:hypothetical protein
MMRKLILILIFVLTQFGCGKKASEIKFEKIIYHSSGCFGTCPTYHLEVLNDKNIKLYAETVYSGSRFTERKEDVEKMGYFIGKLDNKTYEKLIKEIKAIDIENLTFDGANCCDASLKTIIIYYNGKRKYLQSMFPPRNAEKLISILREICNSSNVKRTNKKFNIEDENANR